MVLAIGALVVALGLASPLRADDALRKKALALNELTGANALEGQVRILLDEPESAKKLLAEAAKMAKEKPQPFNINAALVLATIASQVKDNEAGETFYHIYADYSLQLISESGLARAYSGLITLLYRQKKYVEVEKLCREFLEIDGGETIERAKSRMLERMILAMALQGHTDEAVKIVDRLLKKQPDNWLWLEMKARAYRAGGMSNEAIKAYDEVRDLIAKDKRLDKDQQEEVLDEVRYALSGLYVEMDQIDKASEQLKALLTRKPDDPTYNNDLGYVWADHDMNLAEAEKLVRKAIEEDRRQRRKANPDLKPELDKDNPAYLDSLGWVMYKQKKYKEARELLEQSVQEEEGKHLEIYDHLGDAYLALGDKAKAIEAWKKGVTLAGDSKRDKDRKTAVEKKIKANQ